ncbi:chitin synthesis regulation, resistance to congo red-domain-containing protein [Amylocarpus encephaloides]|uniref:Chitin synthesis regulation, resistance to congo red-domain-containing protein n=1 Tax=Amylocarpus encephaloides TaxID=45428 RepID=A0A9P8C4T2_9HELO|nr:chitin synthesis regulation, resistance to congo red-domain-containing protein [Amylocarpus encephaloides]
MTPTRSTTGTLSKRYCNPSYEYCYRYSTWNDWGRWVALAIIVIGLLVVAFLFSCLNNRRRRRRGLAPMAGTGWVPGSKYPPAYSQNNGGYYNNAPHNREAPAPPYQAAQPMPNQQTGTTFNSNDGYYGHHHQNGVEMQPPANSYQPQRGGDDVYAPPQGPPPTKGNAIIS